MRHTRLIIGNIEDVLKEARAHSKTQTVEAPHKSLLSKQAFTSGSKTVSPVFIKLLSLFSSLPMYVLVNDYRSL